jgi:hypothetical protein
LSHDGRLTDAVHRLTEHATDQHEDEELSEKDDLGWALRAFLGLHTARAEHEKGRAPDVRANVCEPWQRELDRHSPSFAYRCPMGQGVFRKRFTVASEIPTISATSLTDFPW